MAKHPLPTIDPDRKEFGLARTACGCPDCVRNCRFIPGYLIPADLQRILQCLAPGADLFDWSRQHLLPTTFEDTLRGSGIECGWDDRWEIADPPPQEAKHAEPQHAQS